MQKSRFTDEQTVKILRKAARTVALGNARLSVGRHRGRLHGHDALIKRRLKQANDISQTKE